jgi:hypothetical protein
MLNFTGGSAFIDDLEAALAQFSLMAGDLAFDLAQTAIQQTLRQGKRSTPAGQSGPVQV